VSPMRYNSVLISQKTAFFIVTAVKTSNLTFRFIILLPSLAFSKRPHEFIPPILFILHKFLSNPNISFHWLIVHNPSVSCVLRVQAAHTHTHTHTHTHAYDAASIPRPGPCNRPTQLAHFICFAFKLVTVQSSVMEQF
jgi:hypothetical protein